MRFSQFPPYDEVVLVLTGKSTRTPPEQMLLIVDLLSFLSAVYIEELNGFFDAHGAKLWQFLVDNAGRHGARAAIRKFNEIEALRERLRAPTR